MSYRYILNTQVFPFAVLQKIINYSCIIIIFSSPSSFFLSASLSLLLPPLGLLSPSFLLAWPQTRSAALLSPAGVLAAATAVAVLIAKISFSLSHAAHAVRRRRMWWSIRSSSRFDGAVSYYARTHMMASCAGPPNVDFSDSNFNHVAHVSSRSCGEVEENVLEHARFSWRTPS